MKKILLVVLLVIVAAIIIYNFINNSCNKITHLDFPTYGFRDNNTTFNGPIYAVAIGDSMTAGGSVDLDKSWPKELQNITGRNVINLGVSGYSPITEYEIVKKFGLDLKPKVVLLGFYSNDFLDDAVIKEKIDSHTINYMGTFLNQSVSYPVREHDDSSISYNESDKNNIYRTTACFNITFNNKTTLRNSDYVTEGNKKITFLKILGMKQLADSMGAKFVLVVIPTKEEVYLPYGKKYAIPRYAVLNFCNDEKIDCLDLQPDLNSHVSDCRLLYFSNDIHLNAYGHRIIAELVARHLENYSRGSIDSC